MTAISPTGNVNELLDRAEQLAPGDFDAFFANILSIHAKRRAKNLSTDETQLLQNINREFPTVKMERFLVLDEQRRQSALSPDEHRELLRLVRQLERFDAQRLQWVGQLAILRNVPLVTLMNDLGIYKRAND